MGMAWAGGEAGRGERVKRGEKETYVKLCKINNFFKKKKTYGSHYGFIE